MQLSSGKRYVPSALLPSHSSRSRSPHLHAPWVTFSSLPLVSLHGARTHPSLDRIQRLHRRLRSRRLGVWTLCRCIISKSRVSRFLDRLFRPPHLVWRSGAIAREMDTMGWDGSSRGGGKRRGVGRVGRCAVEGRLRA
jgi:ribosomal protein L15E